MMALIVPAPVGAMGTVTIASMHCCPAIVEHDFGPLIATASEIDRSPAPNCGRTITRTGVPLGTWVASTTTTALLPMREKVVGSIATSGVVASMVGCAGRGAPLIETIRMVGVRGGKITIGIPGA